MVDQSKVWYMIGYNVFPPLDKAFVRPVCKAVELVAAGLGDELTDLCDSVGNQYKASEVVEDLRLWDLVEEEMGE